MKILLIGHSIIDHIENYDAKEIKPGGIFYSLLGILSSTKKDDTIKLLTAISEKHKKIFSVTYDHADLALTSIVECMPEVILKHSGKGEREEIYKNISHNLDLSSLEKIDYLDGILINMITGYDISSDQLKWLRQKFTCPIYFDVHTLSRGLDENMNRLFRPIPDVGYWLENIDILQCNENELTSICSDKPIEIAINFILSRGVKILIITKAAYGAEAYIKEGIVLRKFSVDAKKIISKNKIGCGDIFGAVFFSSYISSQDVYASLVKANSAGAIAAATENLTSLSKIKLE